MYVVYVSMCINCNASNGSISTMCSIIVVGAYYFLALSVEYIFISIGSSGLLSII